MPVIKSSNAPTALSPFSMRDIEDQARAILLRARGQADQLIKEAQEHGEVIRTQAREAGLVEGQRAGLEEGNIEGRKSGAEIALNEHRARLSELIESLSNAMRTLDESRNRLEVESNTAVTKLAIAIARRVTHRQASVDPGIVIDTVSNALKLVVHASDVRIAIHPDSRATLTEALPKLKAQWPALQHVELIEDAGIAKGGCRILTKSGEVDARLDEQIERIASELLPPSPRTRGEGRGEGLVALEPQLASERNDPSPQPSPRRTGERE